MSGARAVEKKTEESPLAARRWSFGAAVLDERSLALHVNGEAAELERKPLEVLLHLLHHAGEVVTKDELLAAVWPGRVLSDSALTSCMHKLRDALRDDAQEIIRTQHGFGYRLVAPVRVETSQAPPTPRFDFKPGDRPPLRPQWSLQKRLGAGGHGEVWLARHDKTRETRVVKFAADGESLSSLKREITLSRLLHDALGTRPDLARVLDWNLEEAPYFVEAGYSADGSLVDWAAAAGGLRQVPLATRVELAAQVAETLAAAHSVGVLHKDLKPANVLIEAADGPPRIRLSDFGSGGVLDTQRLEQLGITRMGFTATVTGATSGTALYLAPEVIAGQPFTIQSDIYALGVLLYQLVAGDFGKPLAPGWEQDVGDELLREDIAAAAEGHPEQRLADAAGLAQRLRGLDGRRHARAAERAARDEAEQARLEVERVKARRLWVRLTVAASVTGVAVSLALLAGALRARDAAREAAATSEAVSEFLATDMFATLTDEKRAVRDLTVKDVLDAAGARIETRFADRPRVAARVHAALGASYGVLEYTGEAKAHLEAALDLFERSDGRGSEPTVDLAAKLVIEKYVQGELPKALPQYEDILRRGAERLGAPHPKVLQLGAQIGYGQFKLGRLKQAAAQLRAVIEQATREPEQNRQLLGEARDTLGPLLVTLGEFQEAERVLRDAVRQIEASLGGDHVRVARARRSLGLTLMELGRYEEADAELTAAVDYARRWLREGSGYVVSARRDLGRLRLEQGRAAEAAAILEDTLAGLLSWKGPEMDQTVSIRHPLGQAYQRLGRLEEAAAALRLALASGEKTLGAAHFNTLGARVSLADVLREQGHLREARDTLARFAALASDLPERHPLLAAAQRVDGLLCLKEGNAARARAALAQALEIYAYRYGGAHWRTQRARAELALAPGQPS